MLYLALSPAKTLDFESSVQACSQAQPIFLQESCEIAKKLSSYSTEDLCKILDTSDKIARLNAPRYKLFTKESHSVAKGARQAVLAFYGDVYEALDARTLTLQELESLNSRLFIISAMYGLLRGNSLIVPHRLSMGSDFDVGSNAKNIYNFWEEKVINALNSTLKTDDVLLNVASNEYFGVINRAKSKFKIVDAVFQERRGGKSKVIGILAKRARGLMARFIAQTMQTTSTKIELEHVKQFNYGGYAFNQKASDETKVVFVRDS